MWSKSNILVVVCMAMVVHTYAHVDLIRVNGTNKYVRDYKYPDKYIECPNGEQYLPIDWACDGLVTCDDGVMPDIVEICKDILCPDKHIKCPNVRQCIHIEWACEGLDTCNDGVMPDIVEMCKAFPCSITGGRSRCDNGIGCVDKPQLCDGNSECSDSSDEAPKMCIDHKCGYGKSKCKDGLQCVYNFLKCNNEVDCKDGSDETEEVCRDHKCAEGMTKCKDGLQCFYNRRKCNNYNDCTDLSDESVETCGDKICNEGEIKCSTMEQCILKRKQCDGWPHYRDRSDEQNCPGIGRAIATKLVECGAETFALSRTKEDLDSLKDELPNVQVIHLDLNDWDRTREEIRKSGPFDLLVNNAGILVATPFLEMSKEDLDSTMNINFTAAYNVAQVVAMEMVEKGTGGAIVNVSSCGSTKTGPGFSAYSASKAALDMLTKCMALELGPKNIRVNAINPTVVWTPMTLKYAEAIKEMKVLDLIPLGRFVELEDVVNTVLFLLSDKSAMITGECVKIDGGLCVH